MNLKIIAHNQQRISELKIKELNHEEQQINQHIQVSLMWRDKIQKKKIKYQRQLNKQMNIRARDRLQSLVRS